MYSDFDCCSENNGTFTGIRNALNIYGLPNLCTLRTMRLNICGLANIPIDFYTSGDPAEYWWTCQHADRFLHFGQCAWIFMDFSTFILCTNFGSFLVFAMYFLKTKCLLMQVRGLMLTTLAYWPQINNKWIKWSQEITNTHSQYPISQQGQNNLHKTTKSPPCQHTHDRNQTFRTSLNSTKTNIPIRKKI